MEEKGLTLSLTPEDLDKGQFWAKIAFGSDWLNPIYVPRSSESFLIGGEANNNIGADSVIRLPQKIFDRVGNVQLRFQRLGSNKYTMLFALCVLNAIFTSTDSS